MAGSLCVSSYTANVRRISRRAISAATPYRWVGWGVNEIRAKYRSELYCEISQG